ncbi:MAG TPA: hypothetical protein VHM94_11705 [Acidimicrobiia bacterium]|jgi:hypothetical protein|nr:hypothetical protein [Acidimicrobiia bacterium]
MQIPTRRRRDVIVVVVGLAVGVGATLLIERHQPAATAPIRQLATKTDPTTAATEAPDPEAPPAPPTAVAAVEGFLVAEQQGELIDSFHFLSKADRDEHSSAAGWEAAHADLLPPIEWFSIQSGKKLGNETEVVTEVAFTPSLGEVSGLVPGRAVVTWRLVHESDGWRISLAETTVEPRFADESGASEAARTWLAQRVGCAPAEEYEGGLLGNPGLAESLCGESGPVEVGQPGPLDDQIDAAQFVAAFGPEFDQWGRAVTVESPAPLRVVLAPVGDQWVVIGVLPAGESG